VGSSRREFPIMRKVVSPPFLNLLYCSDLGISTFPRRSVLGNRADNRKRNGAEAFVDQIVVDTMAQLPSLRLFMHRIGTATTIAYPERTEVAEFRAFPPAFGPI
jgi:hypothetical protein